MPRVAKRIEFGNFLIIRCRADDLMDAVGSNRCQCDLCGKNQLPSEIGYYIAVLNQWLCASCFEEWQTRAVWYPEDAEIERRNFEFYAPRLGIKCQ